MQLVHSHAPRSSLASLRPAPPPSLPAVQSKPAGAACVGLTSTTSLALAFAPCAMRSRRTRGRHAPHQPLAAYRIRTRRRRTPRTNASPRLFSSPRARRPRQPNASWLPRCASSERRTRAALAARPCHARAARLNRCAMRTGVAGVVPSAGEERHHVARRAPSIHCRGVWARDDRPAASHWQATAAPVRTRWLYT